MGETENQVKEYLSRPARYYNIDGIGEIGGGLLVLGMALIFLLPGNKMIFFIALVALIHYGTKAFKSRVTYRRTGFVAPRRGGLTRTSAIFTAVVAVVLALGFSQRSVNLPLLLAAMFLLSFAFNAARSGPVFQKWWTLSALAAGLIAIGMLPPRVFEPLFPKQGRFGSYLISMAYVGAVFTVSGAITLTQYLKRTKPAAADTELE